MSEENLATSQADERTHSGSEGGMETGINVGDQLRAARESLGLSVSEVSSVLKLSPRQVEALEANDWLRLPKTVIRGFVRNYARYLGLDTAPLMAALEHMPLPQGPELQVPAGSPVKMPEEGRANQRDYIRVISGLIVLLLAVGVYYLVPIEMLRTGVETLKEFVQRGNNSTETVDAPNSENGIDSAVNNVLPATAQPQEEPYPTPPEQSSPVSSAPGTTSVTTALPASSATRSLILSFSEPSWVEVRDRTGQVVFSQLNQPGSRPEITGEPPFALVIGNASHVTLQYEGEAVDLSKRSKDDVARLTLE